MDLESAAESGTRGKVPHAGTGTESPCGDARGDLQPGQRNRAFGPTGEISFPSGTGEAVGVEYDSDVGRVRLLRDVRMSLVPPKSGAAGKKATKTGRRIRSCMRRASICAGLKTDASPGPVTAETSQARLVAGELTLALDSGFSRREADGYRWAGEKKPELAIQQADGPANLSAETLTAYFATRGLADEDGRGRNVEGSRAQWKRTG